MSEQIDWSKAPEDATHWEPKTANVIAGWMRLDGEKWFFWPISTRDASDIRWHECVNDMSVRSEYMIKRPTTPSWSGEGLPPVGTVLEAIDKEINGGTWSKMVVLGVGKHGKDDCLMVAEVIEGQSRPGKMVASLYTGWERSFRPIRTPEQIAADEREAAINQMVADTQAAHGWTEAFGMLHDKGYRKP